MAAGEGRFAGKVAVVTGASRGIGLGIAQRLVDDGARVLVTARKADALEEAVASLGADRAAFVAGSGDDAAHQEEAVRTAIERFGRLDFLVNNTGINPVYGRMIDIDLEAAAKIFAVNVLSAVAWAQQAYRQWMAEHGGAIVNVSSVAGLKPAPNIGMYGASKSALIHVTEELAVELGPDIRVNGVAPAVVKTKFAKALYEGREDEVSAPYPLKRLGLPEDIAGVVGFLLSDDAAWLTGQTITADGGLLLTGGV
ncbi:SDR family oxidoreductase [Aeromicrobium sp. CnD17-E]|jgi:NAD(P)-dependent dehydrogenase (short-subunit alcohol dehydrogenase family)|uniref:SDR family oxidoreductase n=1 Tax=Aeromicrobium sp. CnD17-E TaxID=2954487 RepID=UPI002096F225|nr:SDR family oxidoreductase [Aeromicrobium sp. CnD17-E]MCO7240008.1 SDR family oxidoreductase [Aeromicrobium sp. CnD17-E]